MGTQTTPGSGPVQIDADPHEAWKARWVDASVTCSLWDSGASTCKAKKARASHTIATAATDDCCLQCLEDGSARFTRSISSSGVLCGGGPSRRPHLFLYLLMRIEGRSSIGREVAFSLKYQVRQSMNHTRVRVSSCGVCLLQYISQISKGTH